MFVFSVKADKPKLLLILCAVVIILVTLAFFLKDGKKTVVNEGGISYKASNEEERITFLSQFGWKINEDPVEVTEVIIPSEFDDVYSSYNEIQKNQNLDLELYKGMRAKKWVYEVKNYPGYAADSGCIRATILVIDGLVVGGDVSSIEVEGFMQGFEFPDEKLNATVAQTTAAAVTDATTSATTQSGQS